MISYPTTVKVMNGVFISVLHSGQRATIICILLVTSLTTSQNVMGNESAPRNSLQRRQTQVSFSGLTNERQSASPTGFQSEEKYFQKSSVPFVEASPRTFQTKNYFQQHFHHHADSNYSESIPEVQFQGNVIRYQPPIVKVVTHQHNFPLLHSFNTQRTTIEDVLESEWTIFKRAFNKSYSTYEEERYRREIFIENRNKVSKFNQEYGTGRHNFVQKLNSFADLFHHEFNQKLNGFNRTIKDAEPPERKASAFVPSANVALPRSVDWREVGAVTSVKSQGTCGACYAFAAAGALEAQKFRRTGYLTNLSIQNLIDCTVSYTNNGCVGGVIEYAYEYIKDNKGIDTEHFYPYEERDKLECRYKTEGYGAHLTGYVLLDENDEAALESAVATIGPVAVAIDASPDSFQFYSNGIYFEPTCKSTVEDLNHAVLVVGYGTEPNGQQYWLIKNSYGLDWGIGGYMKIAKFSNNLCGIATYATYPLV